MGSIYDELWRRRRSHTQMEEKDSKEASVSSERFHINELSFIRPAELKDKTLHMLTLNENGPSPFTFVISRSALSLEDSIDIVAARIISEYEKVMVAPTLLEPLQPCIIAGADARQMMYRWRQHGVLLTQRHYLMVANDEYEQRRLLQFTATSNSPSGFSYDDMQMMEALIGSVKLRYEDSL